MFKFKTAVNCFHGFNAFTITLNFASSVFSMFSFYVQLLFHLKKGDRNYDQRSNRKNCKQRGFDV